MLSAGIQSHWQPARRHNPELIGVVLGALDSSTLPNPLRSAGEIDAFLGTQL